MKKTIIFYGIPAYGHICANIYLANKLSQKGYKVIYYATPTYKSMIESNNCEFRDYNIDDSKINLTDASKILKLYRLILEYTDKLLPPLLQDIKQDNPKAIIFDSLCLWGRIIGEKTNIPHFSFYSIVAIDLKTKAGIFSYIPGFSLKFLKDIKKYNEIKILKNKISNTYSIKNLKLLDTLMNKGLINFCNYSRTFQPQGYLFSKSYKFIGPLAVHRKIEEKNDFKIDKKVIYVSLGTIFNKNKRLIKKIIKILKDKKEYMIVLITPDTKKIKNIPSNFVVRSFVNQKEVMKHASLFISAGGLNSLHEALFFGVPSLIFPQQGEQLINAKRFDLLGVGKIHTKRLKKKQIANEIDELLNLEINEETKTKLTKTYVNYAIKLIERTIRDGKSM